MYMHKFLYIYDMYVHVHMFKATKVHVIVK